jgi:hypothetical protein
MIEYGRFRRKLTSSGLEHFETRAVPHMTQRSLVMWRMVMMLFVPFHIVHCFQHEKVELSAAIVVEYGKANEYFLRIKLTNTGKSSVVIDDANLPWRNTYSNLDYAHSLPLRRA